LLSKFNPEPNRLVLVFDFNGFSMRSLKADKQLSLDLGPSPEMERLLFSLKGGVSVNGTPLEERDMMYLPVGIGSSTTLDASAGSIIFLAEASGSKKYTQYVKKYKEAARMNIGQPTFRRVVVQSLTEGDPANRFIAGYVEGSAGEWTSYPPHKHDDKPEAYVYYNIDPGFAVQMVLDGKNEQAFVVHDYDTVLIPRGYHPEVNTTVIAGCYAWIIAAPEHARNMQVEIHPAFQGVNLGRSHLTIK
jgi:5-deoxy-D-glucuronate isomerase